MKGRKLVLVALLAALSIFCFGCSNSQDFTDTSSASKTSKQTIDLNDAGNGTVKAHTNSDIKSKLVIEKDDKTVSYQLPEDNTEIVVPLNLGNGRYSVSIFENRGGTRYEQMEKKEFDLTLAENAPYLSSSTFANFDSESASSKRAMDLTKDLKTDTEKMLAVTEWVADNISYDLKKARILSEESDYYPDSRDTYESKSGICYDYASLTASMLRYLGIPTKVQAGMCKSNGEYHSWNEAMVDGEWIVIDTTYAASDGGSAVRDSSNYDVMKTW